MAEPDRGEAPAPARLFIVPHTHWDREWYRPFQDFRYRLVRLIDRLLDILERDEAFSHFHLDGQTIVLEDYLDIRPQQRRRLQRLIKAGRLAVGPWYVLPDEFLVSGESIIRNLQIGRSVAARFGTALDIGYLPDQFGHIAQMPQILRGFGIDTAVVWRGVGADVGRTEFRWTAPDGSSVFAVYLPQGYSNGRALPSTPAELRQRLIAILGELQPFRRIPSALVMNGTDHQEAQRALPSVLGDAVREVEGMSANIASLREYVDTARSEAESLPEHRGELRSPLRAHLLPGVTSMRVRQKQRDFQNVGRLERYAEPLATWASLVDRQRDLTEFVDWAWKTSVQNHPHDSICGCSVDQVHRDMEYRFDQVDMVLRETIRQGLAAIAGKADTSGEGDLRLIVYNPHPAGVAVVDGEIYLDASDALGLVAADGSQIPLWVEAGPSETLLDTVLSPADLRPHVEAIQGRELFGLVLNGIGFRREGDVLEVAVTADRQARGRFDVAAARRRWLQHLDEPGLQSVRVCARTASLSRLAFVAPLIGHGITQLGLLRQSPPPVSPFSTAARSIENRWYRVTVDNAGSLAIVDKELDLELPRCSWVVDEGDRGDEYNFDPVPADKGIELPSLPPTVHVDAGGAVAARMKVESTYRVPRRLGSDRSERSHEKVDLAISTTVRLYAGIKRIDFETQVDNAAEDHRLRVGFQTPLQVGSVFVEQAFATVERSLDLEPGSSVEAPIGTVPQKTFSALCDGRCGVALFNRGIPEIEARRTAAGSELWLTLVRSVGWLSRGDLQLRNGHAGPGMETPEAQSPGRHRFEYALTTFAGDIDSAEVVAKAHGFAYPPIATLTDAHPGALPRDACLVRSDNARVVVSAVTPAGRAGRFAVRCYNSSAAEQRVSLVFPGAGRVRTVDLRGAAARTGMRCRGTSARGVLRPFEIVTFEVTQAAGDAPAGGR